MRRTVIGTDLRRLLLALAVALLGIGVLAPPASAAGSVTVADPAGDGHGPGDLRALRYSQNGNTLGFVFQVRLQQGTNRVAPTWTNAASQTLLRINLATDGGPGIDYVLRVHPDPSGASLEYQAINRGLCGFQLTFPQPEIIRVTFSSPICLDGAETVRAFARFRFDRGGNGTIDSDDRAPNAGYGPTLPVTLIHV